MNEPCKQHYVAGDDRRTAIAAATRTLIAEHGFEGLRMREIAERIGINIATLHYHVPSKAALVELLAQSLRDEFMAQHAANPRDALSPRQLLALEIDEFEQTVLTNPGLHIVYRELMNRAARDETVRTIISPLSQFWHNQITRILEAGRADGSFRADLDPQAGASIVIGSLIQYSRECHNKEVDFAPLRAELLRCVSTPGDPRPDERKTA